MIKLAQNALSSLLMIIRKIPIPLLTMLEQSMAVVMRLALKAHLQSVSMIMEETMVL